MIFRNREIELSELGLTPEQAFVLDIIHASGGTTSISHIVEMSQRKHNSISSLVDRMAKQGLLKKYRSRRDRRAFRILSTEKGETLLRKAPRKSLNVVFSCLAPHEKRELASYLNRIMDSAYESAGIVSCIDIWNEGDFGQDKEA
jgi:DNA-binding MarR family transcriptional regulator